MDGNLYRSGLLLHRHEGLSASLRQEEEAGNFAPFHSSSEPQNT
jgi:hypothetical protein